MSDPIETPQPVNPLLAKLQFIVLNLESAQQIKGAFTMQECKQFLDCVKTLVTFFTPSEERFADKEEIEALSTLTDLCCVQQSKGIFSINGSVMILDALEELNEAINARKSQDLKFKELQSKVKHNKSKKN